MKKKIVFLVFASIAAMLSAGCGVKQISDAVTVEAGQELELTATDFFNIRKEKAGEVVFDVSKADTARPGIYEVLASYKKRTYTINVTVEDTTAPEVFLKERYVFTNDAAALNPGQVIEGVYDAGGYSASFIRFEKAGNLEVLDTAALKDRVDEISVPGKEEALAELGSTEIPKEEGIYRTVLAVTDESGNTTLEELCLILDKTGARIGEAPDRVVEVLKEDLEKEPRVDPSDYHVFDNVDGVIPSESVTCKLERRDTEEPSYVVHVSYTDRAGNESHGEFLIMVKEKKPEGKEKGTDKAGNEERDHREDEKPSLPAAGEEDDDGLTPTQQLAVDAGYGVMIQTDTGYAVMVHGGEDGQVLEAYLTSLGCRATHFGGSWISCEKDQYLWVASGIVPLITPDDPEFWN